jgi:transcriptional regulator with XRE-family HTH domain
MDISKTIREQRNQLSLSQEELAEKLYVTRQTIGNWENGKSYPDIHSLLLLSQIFDMTIDNLIKGDLEIMKQIIENEDIKTTNRYAYLMMLCLGVAIIMLPLSWYLGFIPGIVIAILVWGVSMYFAHKIEKIKKQYDVQTYREVVAFFKGETVDEITKIRESGKRKYQKFLWVCGTAIITAAISIAIGWILGVFS